MTRLENALTQFENAVANLETSIESIQESATSAKTSNTVSASMSESFHDELSAVEDKLDKAVAIIAEVVNNGAKSDKVTETK